MLLPFVFQVNTLRVLGTPQLAAGESCGRSAQEGLADSSAPLWTRQVKAPFGGKPSAVIYASPPSDEISVKCSASATWELQLPGNCSWSTEALPVACSHSTECPRSPQPLLPIHVRHLRHTGRAGHCFLPWRRGSDSAFAMTNREVTLVTSSLNLVDCHGMLRAWSEQHSLWGSRTAIKAAVGCGNSIRFL